MNLKTTLITCLLLAGIAFPSDTTHDVNRCIASLSSLGLTFRSHETDHFSVVMPADQSAEAVPSQLLNHVHTQFYTQFRRAGFRPKPLQTKLVIVYFTNYKDFGAYGQSVNHADVSWMDAYYSSNTNRVAIAMIDGRTPEQHTRTLTHELAHQLAFNSGLQRRGVMYPLWLTEGLALNFESGTLDTVGLEWNDSRFEQRIRDIAASGRWIPLEQFAGMTSQSMGAGAATLDAYAQSCILFRYLLKHHPQALKAYMTEMASAWTPQQQSSEDLRRRFITAFGPIADVEASFRQYIHKNYP